MKTYDYIIELKRPSYKLIDGMSQFMLFLSIIALLSQIIAGIQNNIGTSFIICFIVIIIAIVGWWIFCLIQRKKSKQPYYRLALFLGALSFWLLIPGGNIIGTLCFIASILEQLVKVIPEVGFSTNEIVFNTLPKRVIPWKNVLNVVLKDGLLTIDLATNKLIQKETDINISVENEKEFNEFCKQQLGNK
jgi:hypothetical protein